MKTHTTIQAETFDQIALSELGNDLSTREIMAENGTNDPRVLTVWRFDYGAKVDIPDEVPTAASIDTLPVYRRPE